MKTSLYKLMVLALVPLILGSCAGNIAASLRKEVEEMKRQCPIDQGEGVILTDVNFFETEKILEYVCSIEDAYFVDEETVAAMKDAMVEALSTETSAFERFSVKSILKQGYIFRYIFTDIDGDMLCSIVISKNDL